MEYQDVKLYSREEYLILEEQAEYKSEYEYGKIKAMSGGTINHGIIGANISLAMGNSENIRTGDCILINSEVKVFVEKADAYVYPDAMVICGNIQSHDLDEQAVVNPTLVVEVLSKSTEGYDRGRKFQKYQSLSSFKEYMLIDQYIPLVDVIYRKDAQSWKMVTTIGLDKSVYLNTLDCYIPMKDIYRNVKGLLNKTDLFFPQ